MRRTSTITEQYSPTFRRRVTQSYLTFSLQKIPRVMDAVSRQGPHRKEDLSYEEIVHLMDTRLDFLNRSKKKIDKIIDDMDQIIRKRMQAHEEGLMTVVRSEIYHMQKECQQIVEEYNKMINDKRKEVEIYNLDNEVNYFRSEAFKYYNLYKDSLTKLKKLNQIIKQKDDIIDELNAALTRVTKKAYKNKMVTQKSQQMSLPTKNPFPASSQEIFTDTKMRLGIQFRGDKNLDEHKNIKSTIQCSSHRYPSKEQNKPSANLSIDMYQRDFHINQQNMRAKLSRNGIRNEIKNDYRGVKKRLMSNNIQRNIKRLTERKADDPKQSQSIWRVKTSRQQY